MLAGCVCSSHGCGFCLVSLRPSRPALPPPAAGKPTPVGGWALARRAALPAVPATADVHASFEAARDRDPHARGEPERRRAVARANSVAPELRRASGEHLATVRPGAAS
jgi:hypothetical protein